MYPTKELSEVWEIITWYTPSKENKDFWWWKTLFVKPPHLKGWNIVTHTEETLSDLWRGKWKLIKKNSIMVCCIGSLWKVWIAWEDLCTNQQINSIYFNEKMVDFKYWYYFCTTLEKIMNLMANKAVVSIINKSIFSTIQIPLPPLSTQKLIVQKLDSAFENIDKNINLTKENLKNLEELNKSVLEKVFSEWEYEVRKMNDICEKITDWTHQTPTYFENWVIFLSSKNVTSWFIDWNNIKYIDEKQHIEMSKRVTPKKWDILLAKNWTTWVWAIVDKDEIFDIYVSLALLRPKSFILSKYLLYFINSPTAKKQFNSRLKWVWVPNLHLKEIKEVEVPIFDIQKQKEIVSYLDQIFEKNKELKTKYELQLKELEELKQSLLKDAFEGRLVKE